MLRILIVFLLSVACGGPVLHAADKSAPSKSSGKPFGNILGFLFAARAFLTYGRGDVQGQTVSDLKSIPTMDSYAMDTTFLMPLSLRLGYSASMTQSGQARFVGETVDRRAEIYLSLVEYGVSLSIPYFISPFVGAGGVAGSLAVSNPRDRYFHNYLAAFDKETKSAWGSYAQGGIDFHIVASGGIRLAVQEYLIKTGRFNTLRETELEFVYRKYYGGIFWQF